MHSFVYLIMLTFYVLQEGIATEGDMTFYNTTDDDIYTCTHSMDGPVEKKRSRRRNLLYPHPKLPLGLVVTVVFILELLYSVYLRSIYTCHKNIHAYLHIPIYWRKFVLVSCAII